MILVFSLAGGRRQIDGVLGFRQRLRQLNEKNRKLK